MLPSLSTLTAISEFIAARRGDGATEATIQRELETIRRAFSLPAKQKRLAFVPAVQTLNIGDTNARRESWTRRLPARDAKNRRGQLLALEGPLREILERRLEARRLDCPLIFHRAGAPT